MAITELSGRPWSVPQVSTMYCAGASAACARQKLVGNSQQAATSAASCRALGGNHPTGNGERDCLGRFQSAFRRLASKPKPILVVSHFDALMPSAGRRRRRAGTPALPDPFAWIRIRNFRAEITGIATAQSRISCASKLSSYARPALRAIRISHPCFAAIGRSSGSNQPTRRLCRRKSTIGAS